MRLEPTTGMLFCRANCRLYDETAPKLNQITNENKNNKSRLIWYDMVIEFYI